jgi:tetratricopeptide (TPR) repeat protein
MKLDTPESLLEEGREAKRPHRPKEAQSLFTKALDESRTSDDRALRATLYAELAYVERTLGELEHAKTHYLLAAGTYRELEQPLQSAHKARHTADILREQGKRDESGRLYAEVLEIYRANADAIRLDVANAIRGFALLKTQMGADRDAIALWEEAREMYRSENIEAGIEESTRQIESLRS